LCEVLQAAHNQGIIHRDLKPTNLMVVDPDTPYEHIKVMDFGLAKLVQPSPGMLPNLSGYEFALGTPGFMSPEQARGEEVDQRGDLYSVGVILFELLTGRVPFEGTTTLDLMLAHATQPPPLFAEVGAESWAPPSIEALIRACLDKDPNKRPANARELADRFETALAHEEVVQEQALHEPPPRDPSPQVLQDRLPEGESQLPDPNSLSFQLEAWMPEKIAAYKLRGFVYDVGGKVVESVPGRIRVRLGGKGSVYAPTGLKSWLGLERQSSQVDMELHLKRNDPEKESHLHITVVFRPTEPTRLNGTWNERCSQIFCDLRAYLMGRSWCS
jgi:serine/threonine-protein kinase